MPHPDPVNLLAGSLYHKVSWVYYMENGTLLSALEAVKRVVSKMTLHIFQ